MLHEVIVEPSLTYTRNRAQIDTDALIKQYSPLVQRLAWHVYATMSTAVEVADLIQIGLMTLIEAHRAFEDRGISFVPYATTRIRGAMIDELRHNSRLCRSGMIMGKKIEKARRQLASELNREPNEREMAVAMEMDLGTYHQAILSAQSIRQESLDMVYSDHSQFFADLSESADCRIEREQISELLKVHVAQLRERDSLILHLFFVEELNLREIGEILNVQSARVCQLKKTALGKLRKAMAQSLATPD